MYHGGSAFFNHWKNLSSLCLFLCSFVMHSLGRLQMDMGLSHILSILIVLLWFHFSYHTPLHMNDRRLVCAHTIYYLFVSIHRFFFFCLRSFTMFPLSVSLRNRSVPLQFPLCSVFFYTARAFWFVRSVFFFVSVFVIFHRHQAAALAIVILRCFWAEAFCNSFITHCSVCS